MFFEKDFGYFETPPEIVRLMVESPDSFCIDDALEKHFNGVQLDEKPLVYDHDFGLLESYFMRADVEENALAIFTAVLHKVRSHIVEWLKKHGVHVICPLQNDDFLFSSRSNEEQWTWTPLIDNSEAVCKLRTVKDADTFPTLRFDHPNIVAEYTFSTDSIHRFTVAPNLSGLNTLEEALHGLTEKVVLQICINVIEGNLEMHRLGYAHCDIKPSNILLDDRNKSEPPIGKLIDIENAKRFGAKGYLMSTPLFSEDCFYKYTPNSLDGSSSDKRRASYEKGLDRFLLGVAFFNRSDVNSVFPSKAPIDEKKDTFSWGITLLYCFTSNPENFLKALGEVQRKFENDNPNNKQKENILLKTVTEFLPGKISMQALIQKMLLIDRTHRPSFQEVIQVLREELKKNV